MGELRGAAWVRNASLGILAWSALELLDAALGRQRKRTHRAPRWRRASAYALAAGLAVAYTRLVPRERWGAKSGLGFAQLRLVGLLIRAPGQAIVNRTELAIWGAVTGALMLRWGESSRELNLPPLSVARLARR